MLITNGSYGMYRIYLIVLNLGWSYLYSVVRLEFSWIFHFPLNFINFRKSLFLAAESVCNPDKETFWGVFLKVFHTIIWEQQLYFCCMGAKFATQNIFFACGLFQAENKGWERDSLVGGWGNSTQNYKISYQRRKRRRRRMKEVKKNRKRRR